MPSAQAGPFVPVALPPTMAPADAATLRIGGLSIDIAALEAHATRPESALALTLFDDTQVNAVAERIIRRGPGRFTWYGRVSGEPGSLVSLTVHDGALAGVVRSPATGTYEITSAGAGVHRVRHLDNA
ncbi:MAG: hypothetical protein V3T70_07255, partial [Phycisphaerae bacterium]